MVYLRRVFPHLPLPIGADKASPIPLAFLSSSHEALPARTFRVRAALRPRSCASDAEHDHGEEETCDCGPHEAEVVPAERCSPARGTEGVATDDVSRAVGC